MDSHKVALVRLWCYSDSYNLSPVGTLGDYCALSCGRVKMFNIPSSLRAHLRTTGSKQPYVALADGLQENTACWHSIYRYPLFFILFSHDGDQQRSERDSRVTLRRHDLPPAPSSWHPQSRKPLASVPYQLMLAKSTGRELRRWVLMMTPCPCLSTQ